MIVVFTSCSAKKDDSVPICEGSRIVQPQYYLDNKDLVLRLQNIRDSIFKDPRASLGTRTTYAFDLYVKAGNAYRDLKKGSYQGIKSKLASGELEWFFLSGGYGVIHAFELARKYQATFSKSIAYQNRIPFTAELWGNTLTEICDAIVAKAHPEHVYVFGSQDYTGFVKRADFWKLENVKMFESTGSSGPFWLSPGIEELASAFLTNKLTQYNEKFPRFVKQEQS